MIVSTPRWSTRRPGGLRVAMLLENDLYPQDIRVRDEARSLVEDGHAVHVIAPRGPGQPSREELGGVTIERYRHRMEHDGRAGDLIIEYAIAHLELGWRGVRALLRGADVLHAHNPPDSLFMPALIGRLLGRRFVFDQHDLFPDLFAAKFGRSALFRVACALQRVSLRLADLVLATNPTQAEIARTVGRKSAERVRIVRNGPQAVVLARTPPLRDGSLTQPHLVYVGALETQDGVELLPELVELLRARHGIDARLTVVGSGSQLRSLRDRVEQLGLAGRVTFTGRTPHDRVLEIIAGADVCLDTARCDAFNHRTTMVKISEYLALGRPTVSYALRETARTAGDSVVLVKCGEFDEYAAAVARLCRDGGARQMLSSRAHRRAAELVWERSAEELRSGYAQLRA